MTHKKKLTFYALIIAFFATYSYIWFYAANLIEERLLAEVEFLKSKSLNIEHGPISVNGFPFHIDIQIDGLYVTSTKNDQFALSLEGPLHGTGSLFSPTKIMLITHDKLKVVTTQSASGVQNGETQSGDVVLSADQTKMIFDFSDHAASEEVASAKDIQVFLTDVSIPSLQAKPESLSFRVERHDSDPFLTNIYLDAKEVEFAEKLIPSLPKTIQHAHFEFSVKGKLKPDLPMDQFVYQWYDSGGMVDVSKMILEWGAIKVAGSGTFSLDESLQPIASFSTEFIGLEETLSILKDQKMINSAVQNIVIFALSPFKEKRAVLAESKTEIYHKLSLSVQSNGEDNDFIIGTIPVFRFPHINWKLFSESSQTQKAE